METGDFDILVGKSSREIVLTDRLHIESNLTIPNRIHRNTTIGDLLANPVLAPIAKELLTKNTKDSSIFSMGDQEREETDLMTAIMNDFPLRALVNFSQREMNEEMLIEMIDYLNSQFKTN